MAWSGVGIRLYGRPVSFAAVLDFLKAITFSLSSFSLSSVAVRVGDRAWTRNETSAKELARVLSAPGTDVALLKHNKKTKERQAVLLPYLYESLPTSSLLRATDAAASGCSERASLPFSSPEESAILRRLSTGEDAEDVFLRLRPAGAYLSMERCLLLSLCRTGLLLRRRGGLLLRLGSLRGRLRWRSLLRLRLGLRRRSS